MGEYRIIDLESSQEWNEYLNKLPIEQKDVYFTPEYYKLYEEIGDGKAKCFVFEQDSNLALYPFLLNSINTFDYDLDQEYFDIQGAYGYNGVISNQFSDEFKSSFFEAFYKVIHENKVIAEFTRFHPLLRNQLFSNEYFQIINDRKTVFIDLNQDHEDILKKFQTTTRKQIRRARNKYGLEIRILENESSFIDVFLNIYHETMKRVNAIPYLYFNTSYFKSLFNSVKNTSFIAFYEKTPIAFIIALNNGYFLNGHLGGSLTDYLHLSPTSFLYSEMIKYGKIHNFQYLFFGGGATPFQNDPLLSFKMNFSESTADFFIGKKIHNQKIYDNVVKQWENRFPDKKQKFKDFLLKYRY
jgi:hypothetical protein